MDLHWVILDIIKWIDIIKWYQLNWVLMVSNGNLNGGGKKPRIECSWWFCSPISFPIKTDAVPGDRHAAATRRLSRHRHLSWGLHLRVSPGVLLLDSLSLSRTTTLGCPIFHQFGSGQVPGDMRVYDKGVWTCWMNKFQFNVLRNG